MKQILALDKRCSVAGCTRKHIAKGLCDAHYARLNRMGKLNENVPIRRMSGGHRNKDGRLSVYRNGSRKFEHVFMVEDAIGKSLPDRAVVHHVDGDPSNNSNDNLVVCEDRAYHALLHVRTRAYLAVGNANWRKCKFCKQHDDPSNLGQLKDGSFFHRECMTERNRRIEARRKPRDRRNRNASQKNSCR